MTGEISEKRAGRGDLSDVEEPRSAGDQSKITFLKYICCHLNSNVL